MVARVLLAGATGLVGGLVAARLAARADVALEQLVRRPGPRGGRVFDFEALADGRGAHGGLAADVGVSCLGTTIARAGTPAAFRRVDVDYVVAFARLARAAGATRFVLVSSVGAGGRGLYLRAKGDAEEGVAALGFASVEVVRPSLLLGDRAERRPAERLAQAAAPLLAPLLLGPLARYAPLPAATVAAAVARLAADGTGAAGVRVHEVPDLRILAGG